MKAQGDEYPASAERANGSKMGRKKTLHCPFVANPLLEYTLLHGTLMTHYCPDRALKQQSECHDASNREISTITAQSWKCRNNGAVRRSTGGVTILVQNTRQHYCTRNKTWWEKLSAFSAGVGMMLVGFDRTSFAALFSFIACVAPFRFMATLLQTEKGGSRNAVSLVKLQ